MRLKIRLQRKEKLINSSIKISNIVSVKNVINLFVSSSRKAILLRLINKNKHMKKLLK